MRHGLLILVASVATLPLAAGEDKSEPKPKAVFKVGDEVWCVAFSPDGKTVASASPASRNKLMLWDVATGKGRPHPEPGNAEIVAVAFSPDGNMLAWSGDDPTDNERGFGFHRARPSCVKLWNLRGDNGCIVSRGHADYLWSVAFSPDGRWLASVSDPGPVTIWDMTRDKEWKTLKEPPATSRSVAFSPNGKSLAFASGSTIHLWEVPTGSQRAALQGQDSRIVVVAFHPGGRVLASGDVDGSVRLWDLATGKTMRILGHSGSIHSLSFSPNGNILVAGGGRQFKVWDVASGQESASLDAHGGYVFSVAFSPDGQLLASGGKDGTVRLWEVASLTKAAR